MNKLTIEQTSNSPRVILDPENLRFEITGESISGKNRST